MRPDKYQLYVDNLYIKSDDPKDDELRIFLGVIGEFGEVCEKVKKSLRDGITDVEDWRNKVELELGDTFFYLVAMCNFYDFDFDTVLERNIAKLTDRRDRGVIKGAGDFR